MKQRPILVAMIGYMIGILWGLYFKFSIVLCYILIFVTYYIIKKFFIFSQKYKFKLLSLRRYSRYLKLMVDVKVICIFVISSFISNGIVLFQNYQYDNLYQDGENIEIVGIVISQKVEKLYYNLYQVKILGSKDFNLYIQVNKKNKELEYGDKIKVQGEYKKPLKQRNYGAYDDKQYLKTLKIAGRVKANQIEVIAKRQSNIILQWANTINLNCKEKIETIFDQEKASIIKGLLLGETKEIPEDIKKDFQISNISHILAISGMHVSYMILGLQIVLTNILGKKKTKVITILILISYAFIVGFSPSIVRAVVMAIIAIGSEVLYRKRDIGNAIAISLFVILFYNPFLILNIGLQLSYLGTIGIILFQPIIIKIFNRNKVKTQYTLLEKAKEVIATSLSAQIMIIPILWHYFNSIGIYFLITNLLVSIIIGPIIILAFLCILLSFIFIPIVKLFSAPLNIGLNLLKLIGKFSEFPFSKIYISTPNWGIIVLYFISILIGRQIFSIYQLNHLLPTHKRVKNLMALFRYKFCQKKKRHLIEITIMVLFLVTIYFLPKDLRIYFVDVGQGDCTLIVTPKNNTILIDGGGNLTDNFDVGEKTVIPYLLDRGFTNIDYVMISHFDQDHVRTDC